MARGTGSILEAELVKNRDLAQLGSNVFINGVGEVRESCFFLDQQYLHLESEVQTGSLCQLWWRPLTDPCLLLGDELNAVLPPFEEI